MLHMWWPSLFVFPRSLRVIERRSTDTLIATDTIVVQAQRYMREKLREEHGVDTLCKALACSRRSLERRFQLATRRNRAWASR